MKAAIIYDSKTGTTAKAAEYICSGLESEGVEAVRYPVEAVDEDAVRGADAVILGSPTYMASVTHDMLTWVQTKMPALGLAGKLGGAYATEQYIHGGAENAIETLLTHEMVYGMMVYSGGGSWGKPVIHLGPVGMSQNIESFKDLFTAYGERFAKQLKRVKGE